MRGNPDWLLLSASRSHIRVIAWQDNLHEVLVVQHSFERAVKKLHEVINIEFGRLTRLITLDQEVQDIRTGDERCACPVDPCKARVWLKL